MDRQLLLFICIIIVLFQEFDVLASSMYYNLIHYMDLDHSIFNKL